MASAGYDILHAPPPREAPPVAAKPRRPPRKWTLRALAQVAGVIVGLIVLLGLVPADAWAKSKSLDVGLIGLFGGIALWRMGWWLTHLVRARIYELRAYPALAAAGQAAWAAGWRPARVHIMITTYRERGETIDAVVAALCREIAACERPATIWLGSREAGDEQAFTAAFRRFGRDLAIDVRIIRQTLPGKRVAIGLILRGMARAGLGANDLVAFMDSDFVLDEGGLVRCLPLFATDPDLHAVTGDEDVVVHGPAWVASWLAMRFAQRRIAMQSHALSGRVLTLTGRFSVFRATHIVSRDFIRLVEADTLENWLWGRYRFLSGDDKSTWYALLARGRRMLYVPDAHGITIEHIEGGGFDRMFENLRRWSGNMLRNGSRAIALGPKRMPFFIWWCLVDQRLAMWTMLFGPLCALFVSFRLGLIALFAYAVYVLATRLLTAFVLFAYSPRIDLNYVWCLYANQLLNAAVKVYMIWRLPMQRWANRGNQAQGAGGSRLLGAMRSAAAGYLTALSVATLLLAASLATGLAVHPPTWLLERLFR